MYVHKYVCMYVHMYVCTYVYMYVCMYVEVDLGLPMPIFSNEGFFAQFLEPNLLLCRCHVLWSSCYYCYCYYCCE